MQDAINFFFCFVFSLFYRYKALDRLDQDRTLMLLRHLGFIHGPIREHCPSFPNCMDVLIEKANAMRARR